MSRPVCGILAVELRLAENHSLKGKRMVVKSLKDRLRSAFNVSVAELEPLDDHQTAVLAVAVVSGSRRIVEQSLQKALRLVEEAGLAEVTASETEVW